MSNGLRILLVVFSLLLLSIIFRLISKRRLPIRYSLIWIVASIVIFVVGAFPGFATQMTKLFGFIGTSNFVIGILLVLLLGITLILTIIVSNQKNQIKRITQEFSILKSKYNGDYSDEKE